MGIDAIAIDDEKKDFFDQDNLIPLEYKYLFSLDVEFNHPLSLVNRIVCWDFSEEIKLNAPLKDSYGYDGQITRFIEEHGTIIGLEIGEIHKGHRFTGNTVVVLSLKRLLNISYDIKWLDR